MRVALLDANVLFPLSLSDLLLDVALVDAYRPLWSADIHAEWIRGRQRRHPDTALGELERRRDAMDRIFPSAVVAGYEHLVPALTLPDAGDRHVLAAAIAGGANTLVTFNLRHFPVASLVPSGVEPIHPELFLLELLRRDEAAAAAAICWAVKRPARLDAITKLGLKELADYCRRLLDIPSGTLCPPG